MAKGANQLFTKTENTESSEAEKPENHKAVNAENSKTASPKPRLVKKSFVFSFELAEDLRKYCFENRKKEVDVVREALDAYFKR